MATVTTPSARANASFVAPRWLLAVAALMAVWMLTLFVQLLNESVHRGESLRQQQRVSAQSGVLSQRHVSSKLTQLAHAEGGNDRVIVAAQR